MAEEWFGPYRLVDVIGRGGMGIVYRAFDTRHEREVALKVLPEDFSADPLVRARFQREARTAAKLEHPHVVPVYDFGDIDGRVYLTMRMIKGRTLSEILAEDGPLAPERAAALVTQVAAALDAAHGAGLIHRDVKPGNIIVMPPARHGAEFAYLMDFGIARALDASTRGALTRTNEAVGTPNYMAPEQFQNAGIDGRADVYSLGCVLYELLTGRRPFPAEGLAAVMFAHLHLTPRRPSILGADVPAAVDAVVARAMAKSPDDRYPSAGDLAAELRTAATAVPDTGDPGTPTRPETVPALDTTAPGPPPATDPSPPPGPSGSATRPGPTPPPRPSGSTPPPRPSGSTPPPRPSGSTPPPDPTIPPPHRPRDPATVTTTVLAGTGGPGRDSPERPGPGDGGPGSPWRWRLAALGVVVVALAAAGTLLLPHLRAPRTAPATSGAPAAPARDAVVATIPVGHQPGRVAVREDGRAVYVTNYGADTVSVLDTATGTVTATVDVGHQPAQVVVGAGRAYVTNRGSGTVTVLDTVTNAAVGTIPVGPSPTGIALSPDGRTAYVADQGGGTVTVVDTTTDTTTATVPAGTAPAALAVTPDGAQVYVTDQDADGQVVVLNDPGPATAAATPVTIPVGRTPGSVTISPDGRHAYVTDFGSGTVSVIDTGTAAVSSTIAVGTAPAAAALGPDGRRLYVSDQDGGTLVVVDTSTGTVTGRVPVPAPNGIALTADGRRAYVANTAADTVTALTLAPH